MKNCNFMRRGTFLSLPADEDYRRRATYLVLPVPYDLTVSGWVGARFGPEAVFAASTQIEEYDAELGTDVSEKGIATLPELVSPATGPAELVELVSAETTELLREGRFIAAVGGEHTITLGLVRAHLTRWPSLTVVALDAHADLRDSYQGSRVGHATVLRRVAESAPLVLLGCRSLSREEAEFLQEGSVAMVTSREWRESPDLIWERVEGSIGSDVYLSVDLDVLDPSIMPAVGTPEPGGIGWEEAVGFIARLARERRLVGMDLVEHAPIPGMPSPSVVAAKFLYRALGLIDRELP